MRLPERSAVALVGSGHQKAERQGFEPWIGFPIHAFQACALSRSATSPYRRTSDVVVRWGDGGEAPQSAGCRTPIRYTKSGKRQGIFGVMPEREPFSSRPFAKCRLLAPLAVVTPVLVERKEPAAVARPLSAPAPLCSPRMPGSLPDSPRSGPAPGIRPVPGRRRRHRG